MFASSVHEYRAEVGFSSLTRFSQVSSGLLNHSVDVNAQQELDIWGYLVDPYFRNFILLAVLGAETYSHPSERCAELVPDRERINVANQLEFMDAIMNPEVGCILFTNTIKFDHETWGVEVRDVSLILT